MAEALICEVSDCGRPVYQSARFCGAHRARRHRYGDPLGKPAPRHRDLTGQRFGTLTVHEYRQEPAKPGQWRCVCDCGSERWVRSSSLTSGDTRSCGERSRHEPAPSYSAMHHRLAVQLGPASDYPCARCDEPAAHWSLQRAGAGARHDSECGPWSDDVNDYRPLCVPCHKRADLAAIRTEVAEANGAQTLWDDDP